MKTATEDFSEKLSLFKVYMSKHASSDLRPVLNSGFITQGPVVEDYENRLKKFFGNERVLSVNSATSGLTLACRLLNFGPDDIILSSPLTCFATNVAPLANGMKIKWVDVDPNTANMSLQDLRQKLDEKTKAILFVHWGGTPLDLDELEQIKDEHERRYGFRPVVIEDCSHAFGAEYKGRKIGGPSENICVFSTQAIKHLTTGDGGILTLPTTELYERAKLLRWFGIDRNKRSGPNGFRMEPDIVEWGYKFHMNDISARIGISNLPGAAQNVYRHRKNAAFFDSQFKNLYGITPLSTPPGAKSASWIYSLRVKNKKEFIDFMNSKNIMVSQVHSRNDTNSCVAEFASETLPGVDTMTDELICIPCGWWLSESDKLRIVSAVKRFSSSIEYEITTYNEHRSRYENIDKKCTYLTGLISGYSQFKETNYPSLVEKTVGLDGEVLLCTSKATGAIAGSLRYYMEPKLGERVAHIEEVVVEPARRGLGLGKMLVEEAVKRIKQKDNWYKIVLSCSEKNAGFYKSCDFHQSGVEMRISK